MGGDAGEEIQMLEEVEELERRSAEGDPAASAALARWIRTSPRHVQIYLRHSMANVELTDLDSSGSLDLEQMIRSIYKLE